MTNREKAILIKEFLDAEYGQVQTFLDFDRSKPWQFLICVMLSAQATDKSVNKVTPELFKAYPTIDALADADPKDIERITRSVGLAHTKSKNIVKTAKTIRDDLHGSIPMERDRLTKLPGVGFKTAGVYLGEIYDYPYIPVDTHVERVSRTLGLVTNNQDRPSIERTLEKAFKGLGNMINTHRQLILFGRNICRPGTTKKQAWAYILGRSEDLKSEEDEDDSESI